MHNVTIHIEKIAHTSTTIDTNDLLHIPLQLGHKLVASTRKAVAATAAGVLSRDQTTLIRHNAVAKIGAAVLA